MDSSLLDVKPKVVIKLSDLAFSYNGRPVLENVNLTVRAGDFIAIVGPNGSAKSTLLKIMIGELLPKTGDVTIFGHKMRQFNDWSKIGYISQQVGNINTSFPATVKEVVSSGYYSGFGKIFDGVERRQAVKVALETVGMGKLSRRLIGELSGGQRQKVFLAKALVKKPQVLFLDEPTTGIDARFQEEFYELLTRLNEKDNMTILIVTHDMDEALKRAKKIGYIKDREVFVEEKTKNFTRTDLTKVLGFV